MTFGTVRSRRLNCFLSQSAYAFNLNNFFALNLIACAQVLGLYIQIETCQKCLNMNFLVMFAWLCTFVEKSFLWNRRLASTCFKFVLPYLIWKFWIWDRGEGRCAAPNSSRMQFYDPRARMKSDSETGCQGLCKPRCATERVIASETSIISRSLRLNLLLFQQSWWLERWYFHL